MDQSIGKLKSDINKLKMFLVVLTIVQVGYMIIFFLSTELELMLDNQYYANVFFAILQLFAIGLFIWFVWRRMPGEKRSKINNTLMILFLGIIGMWLWLPNSRELNKLEKTA